MRAFREVYYISDKKSRKIPRKLSVGVPPSCVFSAHFLYFALYPQNEQSHEKCIE